jgi:putative SOS response-associated peptidase YedK
VNWLRHIQNLIPQSCPPLRCGPSGLKSADRETTQLNRPWLILSGLILKPKPINNARADKLDSFMWRYSFDERRCLIHVTRFAEAEGAPGSKTRTWFSLPDQDVFAVARIWCDTEEWGPAYSLVMTEACVHVANVHDRMPVVLQRDHWARWVEGGRKKRGSYADLYPAAMTVDRTDETWRRT